MENELNIKHRSLEEVAMAGLVDVIYQAKYWFNSTSGFWGLFKFSMLSWNYYSTLRELNLFYRSYLGTKDVLFDFAGKHHDPKLKDYILKMLNQYPAIPFSPPDISFTNYLLLAGSILFFPVFIVILYKDIKKVAHLHQFLTRVISISQSILKVSKNNSWLELIATHERLN